MARDKLLIVIATVIFTCGFSILSVNSIRCHQCNSHLEPLCLTLHLPKSTKLSDKYLKECDQNNTYEGHKPFCRKTAYSIEFTEEHRVVRSCGWLKDVSIHSTDANLDNCLNADNEGFKEAICICHKDGCNSSNRFNFFTNLIGISIFSILLRKLI